MISTIDTPLCLSSSIIKSNVIIDTGASVCISPHRSDFFTYVASTQKIKDLSSSNWVAGEGLIRWSLQDINGVPWSLRNSCGTIFPMWTFAFSALKSSSEPLVVMLFSIITAWTSVWTMALFFLQTTALVQTFPGSPCPFHEYGVSVLFLVGCFWLFHPSIQGNR